MRALVKLCSQEFFDDPSLLMLLLRTILRGRVLEQSEGMGRGWGGKRRRRGKERRKRRRCKASIITSSN